MKHQKASMANETSRSFSATATWFQVQNNHEDDEEDLLYGTGSGWVDTRTSCPHLNSLSSDVFSHTPCTSDLSVQCFSCDAYLDVQVIWQLQSVYSIRSSTEIWRGPIFPYHRMSASEW